MAPHALLLVETLSSAATADAHDRLLEAGFGHVTIIVAGLRQQGAVQISRSGVADLFIRPRFAGQDGFRETIFAGPRHAR